MDKKVWVPVLGSALLLVLAGLAGGWWQAALDTRQLAPQQVLVHVGILFLAALFVERVSEVVLTHWRAQSSELLALAIRDAESVLAGSGPDAQTHQHALAELRRTQLKHSARTRVWAMRLGVCLGLLVAVAGLRALAPLCDTSALSEGQRWLFHTLDIIITAALIAGGSDGVHKLAEVYRVVLENQAASVRHARRRNQPTPANSSINPDTLPP